MALTPDGSWAGCAEFGIRDLFARLRLDIPKLATDRINSALSDLGLVKYVVDSIVNESPPGFDVASYSVKLVLADRSGPAISAKL